MVDFQTFHIEETNTSFPRLGLGTYGIPCDIVETVVFEGFKAGYRHIDCASVYGNEKEIGKGLKKAIDQGIVKRDEIWITSKLWCTYHAKEHVELACRQSLRDLGLDYLDLYLIHWPISLEYVSIDKQYPPKWIQKKGDALKLAKIPLKETWDALEILITKGLIRHIGVSNFDLQLLQDLLTYCRVRPIVNQIECHPYLTQNNIVRYCAQEHIIVTAYCPLGRPNCNKNDNESAVYNPLIVSIAQKYKKTPIQIILRWGLQRSSNMSVIPKTSHLERLSENINIFDFELTSTEIQKILQLNQTKRLIDAAIFTEQDFNMFYPVFT